jgi:cell shape-determining protein MreC
LLKDNDEMSALVKKLTKENQDFFREVHDQRDQLKTLNENLRRETQIMNSRDKENQTLRHENQMLKELLDETKKNGS